MRYHLLVADELAIVEAAPETPYLLTCFRFQAIQVAVVRDSENAVPVHHRRETYGTFRVEHPQFVSRVRIERIDLVVGR